MKDAYNILGVKAGASRDEIIKRFDILLKKHRGSLAEEFDKSQAQSELVKINEAYNLLMGYKLEDDEKIKQLENMPSQNPILKKLNLNERKLKNYIYYYKYHAIIGMVILLILILSIKSCMNTVIPDLNIVFMGDYYFNETETKPFENKIISNTPKMKAIGIDVITLSDKLEGQQAYAMQMKAMTLMAAGDIDICIMDKANFDKYADKGAFINLEGIIKEIGSVSDYKVYKAKVEGDQSEHIFGVDLSRSSILSGDIFKGKELIMSIRVGAKHSDLAIKISKQLLNQNK